MTKPRLVLDDPFAFLAWLRAVHQSGAVCLDDVDVAQVFAIAAVAALARADGPAPLAIRPAATSDAARFALALGLAEAVHGGGTREPRTAALRPQLQRRSFALDFRTMRVCTQSFLHALLHETVRLAWALKVPLYVVNANPAVRAQLELVEAYSLGGLTSRSGVSPLAIATRGAATGTFSAASTPCGGHAPRAPLSSAVRCATAPSLLSCATARRWRTCSNGPVRARRCSARSRSSTPRPTPSA